MLVGEQLQRDPLVDRVLVAHADVKDARLQRLLFLEIEDLLVRIAVRQNEIDIGRTIVHVDDIDANLTVGADRIGPIIARTYAELVVGFVLVI